MPDPKAELDAAAAAVAAAGAPGVMPTPLMTMSALQFNEMMAEMRRSNAQVAQAMQLMQQQQQQQQPAGAIQADGVNPNAEQPRSDRFSKKMSDFWVERPASWFELLESQFQECGIVEQRSKFRGLLQLLHLEARDVIGGLLSTPPVDCYDQAKKVLLKRYQKTEEEMIEELLAVTSLGDRDPLQMLQYLQSLSPRNCTCAVVRVVLRRVLPDAARQGTRHMDDLQEIAERATQIMKATGSVHQVSVQRVEEPIPRQEVAAVTQTRPGPRFVLCSRHERFGDKAYECVSPDTCPMKKSVRRQSGSASGNGPAGRR